jgi:hypothetical protein
MIFMLYFSIMEADEGRHYAAQGEYPRRFRVIIARTLAPQESSPNTGPIYRCQADPEGRDSLVWLPFNPLSGGLRR